MKKPTTRTVIVVLIVLASMLSYTYLNTVGVSQSKSDASYQLLDEEMEVAEETQETDAELLLPDVMMIKKVIETGKRLIPNM